MIEDGCDDPMKKKTRGKEFDHERKRRYKIKCVYREVISVIISLNQLNYRNAYFYF